MEKAIGEKVQRPDFVRMRRPTQGQATHVLGTATSPPARDLEVCETIESAKTLPVHVGITISRVFLREFRQPHKQWRILGRSGTLLLVRRPTTRPHDRAGFALTKSTSLQGLHRFLSLRRPHPFFRTNSSIASTLS